MLHKWWIQESNQSRLIFNWANPLNTFQIIQLPNTSFSKKENNTKKVPNIIAQRPRADLVKILTRGVEAPNLVWMTFGSWQNILDMEPFANLPETDLAAIFQNGRQTKIPKNYNFTLSIETYACDTSKESILSIEYIYNNMRSNYKVLGTWRPFWKIAAIK